MSTLGGSRGERHAKPKYAALDINRLYKSSRGESLEPSTQKNQVPRKHGMQSLGKVPSARRPPANLPSLKAETNTPGSTPTTTDQQSGGQASSGTNSGSATQSATFNSNTSNSNSISNTQTLTTSNSLQTQQATTTHSSSSLTVNTPGSHLSTSYSSSSNIGGGSGSSSSSSVTWSSVTTGHDIGGSSSLPPLYQSPQFQHEFPSLDGSVPGVGSNKIHHKDTHQVQHGGHLGNGGGGVGGMGNGGSNGQIRNGASVNSGIEHQSGDMQVSLRPQTDAASWMQQQQQSGNGKGGDAHGIQQGQAHLQTVPAQFRALMPSFMYRGAGPEQTSGGGARSLTPPCQQQSQSQQQQYSGNGGGGVGGNGGGGGIVGQQQNQTQQNGNYSTIPARQRAGQSQSGQATGQKDYRTNSPNTTYQSQQHHNSERYLNNPIAIQKRPIAQSGRYHQGQRSADPNVEAIPYIEPEVALLQRPIIKEEDLERMDSIAKDDGWTKQDDIDFNQKLIFSDDESGETDRGHNRNDKSSSNDKKNPRHLVDEDNRATWQREREHKERLEREHIERERNERNDRDHRSNIIIDNKVLDRDRNNRDRDSGNDNRNTALSQSSSTSSGRNNVEQQQMRPQQNGHRTSGGGSSLDAGVFERVKQRKEEEEKREYERKQAAAKKLQELEMKMNTKKIEEEYEESKNAPNDDEYQSQAPPKTGVSSGGIGSGGMGRSSSYRSADSNKDNRDYGRYEKYERDLNQRDSNYKDNYIGSSTSNRGSGSGAGNSGNKGNLFSVHFQNNLPPRFLRQQQERNSSSGSGPVGSQSSGSGNNNNGNSNNASNRSITANHHQQQPHNYHHSSSDGGNQKLSVPFAQQYDPRYIHSQNYKQQQQQIRRNASDDVIQSRRNDSQFNTIGGISSTLSSRRRGDSEEDDRFSSSGRESISRNSFSGDQQQSRGNAGGTITPQLARSISDSSQRKTSVSSNDDQKMSGCNNETAQHRSSESHDFSTVKSWAEETDAELKGRHESFLSDHNHHHHQHHTKHDDDRHQSHQQQQSQPKQILQRPQSKSTSESNSKKDDSKSDTETKKHDDSNSSCSPKLQIISSLAPTQILRRSESPKAWSECVAEEQEPKTEKVSIVGENHATPLGGGDQTLTSGGIKKIELTSEIIKDSEKISEDSKKETDGSGSIKKDSADEKTDDSNKHGHTQKRPSPRGGRQDMRGPPSRGYGMYRGSGSSWSRRGGGGGMRMGGGRNYNDHWSESENSDDIDDDYHGGRRMDRSPKVPRKDSSNKSDQNSRGQSVLPTKEGFAPRGEPSRRGRGGGSNISSSSSSFRRGGGTSSMSSSGPKRMDSYGLSTSSKNLYNSGGTTSSNDDKNEKSMIERKQDLSSTEDRTKLNQIALSAGLSNKQKSESSDESKNKSKILQPLPLKKDDKKSPPKTFGSGSQYQSQNVGGLRKDISSGKNESNGTNIIKKDDDDSKKDAGNESDTRKKSLSREKELLPQTQRSNSSGHISSSGRSSSSHLKKDDRIPMSNKPITKPPPGLGGFKQSRPISKSVSTSQPSSQQQQLNKDQSLSSNIKIGKPITDRDRERDSRSGSTGGSNGNVVGSKTNLPPRLAKQWENRMKRDGGSSQNDSNQHQSSSNNSNNAAVSAWEKPLQQPIQTQDLNKNQSLDLDSISGKMEVQHQQQQQQLQQQSSQSTSTDSKTIGNCVQKSDPNCALSTTANTKAVLDGSTTPVNTIIFENTNYKTVQAPLKRQNSTSSQQSGVGSGGQNDPKNEVFKSQSTNSVQDIQEQHRSMHQQAAAAAAVAAQQQAQNQQQQVQQQIQQQHHQQQEAITTALSQMAFDKADSDYDKDMKLGFAFDTEFGHLTDDKSSSSSGGNVVPTKPGSGGGGLCLPRSSSVIHSVTSVSSQNSTISPSTADLNMKIASVKKVWENVPPMPTVLEHATVTASGVPPSDAENHGLSSNFVTSQHQQHLHHFAAAAAAAAHAAHGGGNIHVQHTLSSPGPPSYGNSFEPSLEQHFGNKDSVVVGTGGANTGNDTDAGGYSPSPQHVVGSQGNHQNNSQNLALKHAAEALAANNSNVCKVKPNQQQMHQSGLGLSPPPAMQQGATQLHQAPQPFYQPSQFGAMPTIPSPPAVLFNSSPMPSQGGLYGPFQIEAGRSQFSQFPGHYGTAGSGPYSAYAMQTPPNMPTAPDMYPSLTSQFRMGGAVQTPFNQSQQLNNPSTVLISSSSNSLMSASVKPSSQQIGAIGSKSNAASVGQPYGQQYMNLYPPQQAPPPLQSNSYYSNSAGGQGAAYFSAPTAAGTQNYGLQAAAAGIFGGHGAPAPSSAPPQQQIANFSSQFINSPLLTAAAINQFRGAPTPQTATQYMKSNQGQNHLQDSMGRQLKSPLGSDVSLNLAKQVQPQQSPPHHKNYATSWDLQNQVMQQQQQQQSQNQSNRGASGPANALSSSRGPGGQGGPQRYPTPIQRPTNYPTHQQQQSQQQQQPQQQQQQSQQPQSQSQRPVRQPHSGSGGGGGPQGGPMNKHYYGGGGGQGGGGGGGGAGGRAKC